MRIKAILPTATAALALAAALTGCGGDQKPKAPPGSPENPIVATPPSDEGATSENGGKPGAPNYKSLVDAQSKHPVRKDRDNPCALVTKAQAEAILGAKLLDPLVAPQGPTCIYRDRSGRSFATVAIQAVRFRSLRTRLRRVERIGVSDRTAYCGTYGQPMLYLPLEGDRVLSIAAPCDTAVRFARRAAPRLRS